MIFVGLNRMHHQIYRVDFLLHLTRQSYGREKKKNLNIILTINPWKTEIGILIPSKNHDYKCDQFGLHILQKNLKNLTENILHKSQKNYYEE